MLYKLFTAVDDGTAVGPY